MAKTSQYNNEFRHNFLTGRGLKNSVLYNVQNIYLVTLWGLFNCAHNPSIDDAWYV